MTKIQLDCFFSAARSGSLAATARELFLSVQAVSSHIQNLEKEFSIPLFRRTPEGVKLTEEGRKFYRFAMAWTEVYDNALKSIDTMYNNMSLKFTIAFSEWVNPLGNLFDAIEAFSSAHKNTELKAIHCSNKDLMDKLAREEIDAAIMCDTQVSGGADFETVSFAPEQLMIYYPPAVHDSVSDGPSPAFPQIDAPYGSWSDEETLEMSRRMSGNLGLAVTRCYTMPNFYSVVACAETVPCFAVSDARFGHLCYADDLQRRPLNINSSLCCIWNKKNENPLLPQFIAHLQDYFKTRQ